MEILQKLLKASVDSIKEGIEVCKNLYPTIIFILFILKVIQVLGFTDYLSIPFIPLMELMGLPAEFGIVWVVGILSSVYSSLAVLPAILVTLPPVSVEQTTILGLLILIAHNLIIEGRITAQCGISMNIQILLRFIVAVLTGYVVHLFCSTFGFWQEEASIYLVLPNTSEIVTSTTLGGELDIFSFSMWKAWFIDEFWNLFYMFIIICLVMAFNKVLNASKLSYYAGKILTPLLRLLGVSKETTNVMIVGLFMGIIYGSGIIMQGSRERKFSACDNFAVLSFMGIAHALVEDTLLLMLIGGSLWGLLGVRLIVALVVGSIINVFYLQRKSCTQ